MLTANIDDRTITGLMLPYGDPGGRTNLGRVVASAGSVSVPDDPSSVVLNLEHERKAPVGKAVSITEEADGLHATFRVARTRAGDDLLAEVAEGLRTGLSVEVDNPVIRAGKILGGALTACAAVVAPAFPNALMTAADAGEIEDPTDEAAKPAGETEDPQATEATDKEKEAEMAENENEQEQEQETQPLAASAPAGGVAAKRRLTAAKKTKDDLFRMLATAWNTGGGQRALTAALSDVVPANILGIEQPQFVHELWSGKAYQRRIVPLFNHAPLSSFKVQGWRWVTKPVVAPYAGDKTAVPSNPIETEPVEISAERIAGAHDIDRKFRDFGDTEFYAAYYAAMTESYAQVSDAQVLGDVITAAGAAVPVGTVPTGVATGLVAIIDGALEVLNGTNSLPTFAVLSTALWREVVLTKKDDTLAYLNAAMGLEDGTLDSFRIVPNASLADDQVLVGAKDAVTVHELGGESPIRVEALDIANGGVDSGVFGYYAVNVHDADGLVLVDTNAGA